MKSRFISPAVSPVTNTKPRAAAGVLSVGATMPRFVEMERRYGSVIRGLRAAARKRDAEARGTSGARWSKDTNLWKRRVSREALKNIG